MSHSVLHKRIIEIEARLLQAWRNWEGADRISEQSDEINKTAHRAALGSIQRAFTDLAVIQTAALFDDSKRNKTHSIPHLLTHLQSATPNNTQQFLSRFKHLLPVTNSDAKAAFADFAKLYKEPPLSAALSNVKARRDQQLAHFDEEPSVDDLRYSHVEQLLAHCRIVLRMASTCFGAVLVGPDDELVAHLSIDARIDIKRLVTTLLNSDGNLARSRASP